MHYTCTLLLALYEKHRCFKKNHNYFNLRQPYLSHNVGAPLRNKDPKNINITANNTKTFHVIFHQNAFDNQLTLLHVKN